MEDYEDGEKRAMLEVIFLSEVGYAGDAGDAVDWGNNGELVSVRACFLGSTHGFMSMLHRLWFVMHSPSNAAIHHPEIKVRVLTSNWVNVRLTRPAEPPNREPGSNFVPPVVVFAFWSGGGGCLEGCVGTGIDGFGGTMVYGKFVRRMDGPGRREERYRQ